MADIPQRQRERADFLIKLLDTQTAKDIAKQLGYTDHAFLSRLQRNLAEYASIADAPRQGRARKYTDELLGQARDHMMGEEHYVWSMQEFVSSLVEEGIVESGTSVAAFWEAFAPYMQQQGLRLVYGTQRLTFAMGSHHASARLSWCMEQQHILTALSVREFWFTDEITLEYGGHPAGEACPEGPCESSYACPPSARAWASQVCLAMLWLARGACPPNVRAKPSSFPALHVWETGWAQLQPGQGSPNTAANCSRHCPELFSSQLNRPPHLLPMCPAGNKHMPAHWRIQGFRPRPAQHFVPSQGSKSIKLCVFVKSGQKTKVVDLRYSGLATADDPITEGSGSGEYGWSSQRYAGIVAYYLLGERDGMRSRRPGGRLKLIHDRDPAHTGNAFKSFTSSRDMTVVTLPAKAPDLDPLDYAVFGTVKRAWEKQVWQGHLHWSAQCDLAIRLLEAFDASAAIDALPHRIQQCIDSHGWHFEG